MPCSAVRVWWAASASSSARTSRLSRSADNSRARFFRVLILAADRPSPHGMLHLGHAYSAVLNDDLARGAGGQLLLRVEDIDATRCRAEFEGGIFEDLGWLSIAWQLPVRRQSEHLAVYSEAVRRLSE